MAFVDATPPSTLHARTQSARPRSRVDDFGLTDSSLCDLEATSDHAHGAFMTVASRWLRCWVELTKGKAMGSESRKAWSLRYLGGGLCLMAMIGCSPSSPAREAGLGGSLGGQGASPSSATSTFRFPRADGDGRAGKGGAAGVPLSCGKTRSRPWPGTPATGRSPRPDAASSDPAGECQGVHRRSRPSNGFRPSS
jgi:hypothetical protein